MYYPTHNYYKKYNYGLEKALKHIEEARELSEKLGGTDKDIKKYFFSLSETSLATILVEYGKRYGWKAETYATKTFYRWKVGSRQMSGLVADRLFDLLPIYMPLNDKYKLIKGLWEKYCPRSYKTFTIDTVINTKDSIDAIRNYLLSTVVEYKIPALLQNRFTWLSAGDVEIKQQLLNYFLQQELNITMNALEDSISAITLFLEQCKSMNAQLSKRMIIGKHAIELNFISSCEQIVDPKESHGPKEAYIPNSRYYIVSNTIIVLSVVIALMVLYLLVTKYGG